MRICRVALMLGCLVLLTMPSTGVAQELPQVCKDALVTRSPQAQVDLFTRCLETGSLSGGTKATTLKQRAVAYMHLGQHQRAIDDINQAIKIKPDDSDNFYLRGFAYRALGQNQRAVEDSTQAIGLEPDFAAAYANRAFAQKSLGNVGQAQSDARRAKELDPTVKVPMF
jgi:tetratricopeptide (TPR) repeat protein